MLNGTLDRDREPPLDHHHGGGVIGCAPGGRPLLRVLVDASRLPVRHNGKLRRVAYSSSSRRLRYPPLKDVRV